jgi:hypothetical protein
MRFFILGDSWGVGEWTNKTHFFEPVPGTGLDHYLREFGHSVTNISAGSAGNFGQLRHAYWTLKQDHQYDYAVWFHTESFRDIQEIIIDDPEEAAIQFPEFDITKFDSSLAYINHQNYKYAQMISEEYNIPFVVVGGQSPVGSSIVNFSFARHVIPNWLSELLGGINTPINTFFSFEKIQRILDHYQLSQRQYIIDHLDQLDQQIRIEDFAKRSANFPDNCHPARHCFQLLAKRILGIVERHAQQT